MELPLPHIQIKLPTQSHHSTPQDHLKVSIYLPLALSAFIMHLRSSLNTGVIAVLMMWYVDVVLSLAWNDPKLTLFSCSSM